MYYTNNPAQAELHFRTAIRFNETYAPPYLHLANLFNRSTRYAEAIETINPALDKVGDLRTGLQEALALAYEMRGEYQKAIRAYKGAETATAVDMEVERMLKSVRRCRRKRIAFLFAM